MSITPLVLAHTDKWTSVIGDSAIYNKLEWSKLAEFFKENCEPKDTATDKAITLAVEHYKHCINP